MPNGTVWACGTSKETNIPWMGSSMEIKGEYPGNSGISNGNHKIDHRKHSMEYHGIYWEYAKNQWNVLGISWGHNQWIGWRENENRKARCKFSSQNLTWLFLATYTIISRYIMGISNVFVEYHWTISSINPRIIYDNVKIRIIQDISLLLLHVYILYA